MQGKEKAMTERSTLKTFKQGLVKGLGIGIGISIALATTTLLAAAAAMKVFSAGEVISAADLNRNFTMAAPEGAVMAFYLGSCPDGWTPADGSPGTPDLRGRFIRGLNDFGSGAATVDPQGTRALGSVQTDAFQGHKHNVLLTAGAVDGNGGNPFSGLAAPTALASVGLSQLGETGTPLDAFYGLPRIANETRPVNVALIYCMRKN